ncbi:conserved hypothetical protein, partial [Ricinus communis]
LAQRLQIGPGRCVQHHADRHLAVAEIELRRIGVGLAQCGDAGDGAERCRGDAQTGGFVGAGFYYQLRRERGLGGQHVRQLRQPAHLHFQFPRRVGKLHRVLADEIDRDLLAAAVGQEGELDVGCRGQDRPHLHLERFAVKLAFAARCQPDEQVCLVDAFRGGENGLYLGSCHELLDDAIGHALRLGQPGSGRQGHFDLREIAVAGWQEAGRQKGQKPKGAGEDHRDDAQSGLAMVERPAEQLEIACGKGGRRSVGVGGVRRRLHQVGGHQRCQQAGNEQREQHGDSDRQAELLEILTDRTTDETDGRETATM